MWFDGACSGNPGPMGAGAVVEVAGRRESFSRNMGHGTNNEAEYHAIILGLLRAHAAGATRVTIRGDSQLVLRQLEGRYAVKAANLQPLVAEAKRLLGQFERAKLEWVPRLENAEADAAARHAIGM
ncbi:MAG: ribonuclease [Thermoplasmata archaeon]|nr:ribonuclease [Thermoplasmata archaeon]